MSAPYDAPGSSAPAPTAPVPTAPITMGPGSTPPGAGIPAAAYGQAAPSPTSRHEHAAGTGGPTRPNHPATGDSPKRQGGALAGFAALVQFGLLVTIVVGGWRLAPELGNATMEAVENCEAAGGDVSCLTSPGVWRHGLLPIASVIAAFSLFRGAMAGNARRPGGGLVLTVLGFVVLVAAMAYGWG